MEYNDSSYMLAAAKHDFGHARTDNHMHNDYEIILITNGELTIEIADKIYHAKKDDILLITNMEYHKVLNTTDDYMRYYIALRPIIADKFIRNPMLIGILKNHTNNFCHCVNLAQHNKSAKNIFDNLIKCSPQDDFTNELILAYIIELLVLVCRSSTQLMLNSKITYNETILTIQRYLDKHYTEDIKIKQICLDYHISPCYLSHIFKKFTGFSPKQYLTHLRLRSAATALCHTEEPINIIAMNNGFNDINSFIKMFKKEFGCLPKQYRKETQ